MHLRLKNGLPQQRHHLRFESLESRELLSATALFSTYFGTSGAQEFRELGFDPQGNIVVAGLGTFVTSELPGTRTIGSSGNGDILVAEFSPDGSRLLWLTIIGGTGQDRGYGMQVDAVGDIFISGATESGDFPTTAGAFERQKHAGGGCSIHGCDLDAYVLKLSGDGSHLIYSTFIGGTGVDRARGGVAVDAQGYAYVVGLTNSLDLPARVNSYLGGTTDGFVTKVTPDGSGVVYSRYLGGSGTSDGGFEDGVIGAVANAQGEVYVNTMVRAGDAETTANAYDRTFNGGLHDIYLTRLSADGRQLLYATYFGGSSNDWGEHRMTLDGAGNVYLLGVTTSHDLPTINADQAQFGGGFQDSFLVKFNASGQVEFSTYIGGSGGTPSAPEENGFGPSLDSQGNIYVAGRTTFTDFAVTSDALQATLGGGYDAWFRIYGPDGQLRFSTLYGGSDDEYPRFVGVNNQDQAVITGHVLSSDFPTTSGAYDRSHNGGGDGFLLGISYSATSGNNPPTINDQSFTVAENTPSGVLVGRVAASDPDPGTLLTYSIVAGNSGGAFTLAPITGDLRTSNSSALDFETTPVFLRTVRVTDSGSPASSDTATMTVNLTDVAEGSPGNAAPVSADDFYLLESSSGAFAATIGVLSDDVDSDGDPLSAVVITTTTRGTLVLNPGGTFVYTPGPQFAGFDRFTNRSDDGQSLSNIATVTLVTRPAALVQKLYEQVLLREPEPQGWEFWSQQIVSGAASLGTIASGIFESAERLDPLIRQMYRDYLFREAEEQGVAFWRDAVWRRDGGPDRVISGIVASDEFFRAAGSTSRLWVGELYRRLLGRDGDVAGMAFWTARIDSGEATREEVVLGFVQSDENHRNLIRGWFSQYLMRPATQADEDFILARMRAGALLREIQIAILDSAEYSASPLAASASLTQRI